MDNSTNIKETRSLAFEMQFAPTDSLHLLNNEQTQECFSWLSRNNSKRMNDWPGWEVLNLPH